MSRVIITSDIALYNNDTNILNIANTVRNASVASSDITTKTWDRLPTRQRPWGLVRGHVHLPSEIMIGKVQNMDQGSMDPLRGPGPWTRSIKIWTGSMDQGSMDRVHGPLDPYFYRNINNQKPRNISRRQMFPGFRYVQTVDEQLKDALLQNNEWTNFIWSWCLRARSAILKQLEDS